MEESRPLGAVPGSAWRWERVSVVFVFIYASGERKGMPNPDFRQLFDVKRVESHVDSGPTSLNARMQVIPFWETGKHATQRYTAINVPLSSWYTTTSTCVEEALEVICEREAGWGNMGE